MTDRTLDIIKTFAERAPFKVWWEQNEQNLGYAGNFNKALGNTTGDLVFLSDQDDVWFPEKIDTIAQRASESSAFVLMNNAALTDANLNEVGLTKLGQIHSAGLSNSSFVMGCCAAIKRELMELCLPVPKDYPAHDSWIVKFAEGMKRKEVIDQCLQYYRRHKSNESQFIANRLQRVSRWDAYSHRIHKIMSQEHSLDESYNKHSILLGGVQTAKEKCGGPFWSELKVFEEELSTIITAIGIRTTIRKKSRAKRIIPVATLWKKGGYRYFSGFKSALIDIMLN